MGAIRSKLARPFKNWNIEDRAHKFISKSKPLSAPTYESTRKQIELVNQMNPEYKQVSVKKNTQLDNYLKNVYVSSDVAQEEKLDRKDNPDRPLPKDKTLPEPFEYGFYEPKEIKLGKVSLRQAIDFMTKHNHEPEKYTADSIAAEYKLKPKAVADILEYYKIYEVWKHDSHVNAEADAIAQPMAISLKSAIRIPHTKKKKKVVKKSIDEEILKYGKLQIEKPEDVKKIKEK